MTSEKEFIKQLIEEKEEKEENRKINDIITWIFVSLVLFFSAALCLVFIAVSDVELWSLPYVIFTVFFFSFLYFISWIISMIIYDVRGLKGGTKKNG